MYKLSNNSVIRLADGACIPFSPGNRHYAAYLDWLADGNTPLPIDPAPPEVIPLSPRQARKMLRAMGMEKYVETYLTGLPQPHQDEAREDWEYALEVRSDWPLIQAMKNAIPLTQEQLLDMFRYARTLP